MRLSIFTTTTLPSKRGDNAKDAQACYRELADEVVNVSGDPAFISINNDKYKIIYSHWPYDFNWPFIGQQFQRGYEAATGDWVIHADLDFIFHEKDFEAIRMACEKYSEYPALSFYKWQFILPDRYNLKSRLVIAVNKKRFGERIRFDSGGDLCQPSLDGKYIKPDDVPEAGVPIYNYEKILKTEAQIRDDVERMARAWYRHYGYHRLGDDETAYDEWLNMVTGRFSKPQELILLEHHPKYVQDTIRNLKPNNWGYSGFGHLKENHYVESGVRSR